MGARTPDAYRIGAGQVAQEYPADAVPVRLSKQPSPPTMSRAPQAPPVAKSPALAREYAHLDEAGVAFEGD